MRRRILFISVFLCAIILTSSAAAQVMATTKTAGKQKDIILSTEDIKESYKVIGIVSIRSGEVDLTVINNKLKDAARELGADYVIGVDYFNSHSGYIYAYGTAVKIKE